MLYDVLLDDGAVRMGVSPAFLLPQSAAAPTALWLYRRRRQRLLWHHRRNSNLPDLLPAETSIYDLFWEDYWWYSPYAIPTNSAHHGQAPVSQALYEYYIRRAEREMPLPPGSAVSLQSQALARSRQARWDRLQQDEVVAALVRETAATTEAQRISAAAAATPGDRRASAWWEDAWADGSGESLGDNQSNSRRNDTTTTTTTTTATTWWDVVTSNSTSSASSSSSGGGATGSW